MLTQLVLGWTALLSGIQPAVPSVTTSKYKEHEADRTTTLTGCVGSLVEGVKGDHLLSAHLFSSIT